MQKLAIICTLSTRIAQIGLPEKRTDDPLTSGAAGSQARRATALAATTSRGTNPMPVDGWDKKSIVQRVLVHLMYPLDLTMAP